MHQFPRTGASWSETANSRQDGLERRRETGEGRPNGALIKEEPWWDRVLGDSAMHYCTVYCSRILPTLALHAGHRRNVTISVKEELDMREWEYELG
jgi:hypothetical protein